MRKAVVGGAVLALVGLLLLSESGVPLIPGRPPKTSNPDPVGIPSGGPTADLDALQVLSHLDLEADDLSAPMGSQDSTPAADLSAPVVISVYNPPAFFDAEVDNLDGIAEFDRDDGSTRDTEGTLVAVLLALIVLKASRDQDSDRRLRAAAPGLRAGV